MNAQPRPAATPSPLSRALTQPAWFAGYTYPKAEKNVYDKVRELGLEAFLPLHQVVRQWSDRKKKLEVPLFPNYLFVKITSIKMWMVLAVKGVVKFVSFDNAPKVVQDSEISWVRKLIQGTGILGREASPCKGDKVQVTQGPLSGLVGRVSSDKGLTRLFVELEALQQFVSVEINADLLQKIE